MDSGLLNKLPPELVGRVAYRADPADLLNFALTCKRLAVCSEHILRRHQDAYAKYGLCSDISPETVPALLRLVMKDPIVAWNVRTFEVWGVRYSWDCWKQFRHMFHRSQYEIDPEQEWDHGDDEEPDVGDTEDGDREFDISTWNDQVDRHFKRVELEELMRYMQKSIGFSSSQAARAWEEIQEGNDGILKMLLFSLCPRLNTLRYADTDLVLGLEDVVEDVVSETAYIRQSSLGWLIRAIYLCRVRGTWPPGLQALRDVAIGIECGLGHGLHQPPILATSLYHLPGIKTLYIHGSDFLSSTDPGLEDEMNPVLGQGIFALTPGCSSLEHVFFDGCNLQKDGGYHCFTAAPRNLVSFACRAGAIDDRKKWLSSAVEYQSKTLEAMMFYDDRDNPPHLGSHSAELQKQFENLRCFYLQVASIEEVMKDPEFPGSDTNLAVAFLVQWLQEKLSRSTEVIVCDYSWHPDHEFLDKTLLQFSDIILAAFLDSGVPEKLKAVYFNTYFWGGDGMTWFPYLFHAGEKHGIDICFEGAAHSTFTKYESYFPRPLERYDLLTGPFASRPRKVAFFDRERATFLVTEASGGRVFNPFFGEWDHVGRSIVSGPAAE